MSQGQEVTDDNGRKHTLKKPDMRQHIGPRAWCNLRVTDFSDLPPELGFTRESWQEYLSRGMLFTEDARYIRETPQQIADFEACAREAGWKLIVRYTNHSGVCPPNRDSQWVQFTSWLWGIEGKQNIMHIQYTEYLSPSFRYESAEATWIYGTMSTYAPEQHIEIPSWMVYNGGMADAESRSWNLMNKKKPAKLADIYNSEFWQTFAQVPTPDGPFNNLQVTNMNGQYTLPGAQTDIQRLLQIEVGVKFLQLLHASEFRKWCRRPWGDVDYHQLPGDVWQPCWFYSSFETDPLHRPIYDFHNFPLQVQLEDNSWVAYKGCSSHKFISIMDFRALRMAPTARKLIDMIRNA